MEVGQNSPSLLGQNSVAKPIDVKQALGRRSTPMDKVAIKAGLRSHMQGLQRHPTKVQSFFQAPDVRYAA